MGDVFFGTKEPVAEYPELEEAIRKHVLVDHVMPCHDGRCTSICST